MGTHREQEFFLRLLITLALSGCMVTAINAQVAVPKARGFFVFGDSYADTGNEMNFGICRHPPYGMSWPGRPTGRCGDGRIQTDYLAELIGLPSPPPYNSVWRQNIATGLNFAIAGSGVTYALGVEPLGAEVDQLELLVNADVYSPEFLGESVAFISISGNDYNGNFNPSDLFKVVEYVIEGLALCVQRLYDLGFKNFMVANLAPINCLPAQTASTNYTSCPTATDPAVTFHNQLLQQAITELDMLPDSNIITLDEYKAFGHLLNYSLQFGITEKLVPCCRPNTPSDSCGLQDVNGNPLYTVCEDPSLHTYWDSVHPVQKSWIEVVGMFANTTGFVIGAPTLNAWLEQNAVRPIPPAAAPSGFTMATGASGQLDRMYHAMISQTKYTESIGLLQDLNLAEPLQNLPAQVVTIFLPDNMAYTLYPQVFLDHIYGKDQVLPVVANHAVRGFYDEDSLLTSPMMNATTLSNLTLPINSTSQGIFVGAHMSRIMNPNIYVEPGFLVVHGIDQLLLPSNLVFT